MLGMLTHIAVQRQRRMEQKLRLSEELLDSVVSNLPGGVYRRVLTPEGSYHYPFANKAVHDLFGLDDTLARVVTYVPCYDAEFRLETEALT